VIRIEIDILNLREDLKEKFEIISTFDGNLLFLREWKGLINCLISNFKLKT
jgi:hypothetical protein